MSFAHGSLDPIDYILPDFLRSEHVSIKLAEDTKAVLSEVDVVLQLVLMVDLVALSEELDQVLTINPHVLRELENALLGLYLLLGV